MSEQTIHYRYRFDWVAYTRSVLVCWEVQTPDGGIPNRQMVRLMVLGEVDDFNVRAIPMRAIAAADPDAYPTWTTPVDLPDLTDGVPAPPQMREVWEAWEERDPTILTTGSRVEIGPRAKGEPVDDFYRRVADAYRAIAAQSSTPTTTLAIEAGVNKNTAARWVHEARKRGHLPPTTRGRIKR